MHWIELHITTTAAHANTLSDELMLYGAQAVTFQDAGDQPVYEPLPGAMNLWHETIVVGLFDNALQPESILCYLEQQQTAGLIKHFELRPLEEQDWERVCLDHFKPIQIGKRLWICPSWHTPPNPNTVNVMLDPGLAFGTGTHPTTALCLEWLEANIDSQVFAIDYGCGSGILSIAALKLGVNHILAIDHDPQALEATQENGRRNHLFPPKLNTHLPPAPNKPADLIMANILAQPLIELAPVFASLTLPKSQLLLSGILPDQADSVWDAYATWFNLEESTTRDGWVRMTGIRK